MKTTGKTNGISAVILLALSTLFMLITGCGEQSPPTVLVPMFDETSSFCEISGIWDSSKDTAKVAVNRLRPGDWVMVMGVDHQGFDDRDVRMNLTQLPKSQLPSLKAKQDIMAAISDLQIRPTSSGYPREEPDPVTGAKTKGTPSGTDTIGVLHYVGTILDSPVFHNSYIRIIIFTDFQEEPPEQYKRQTGASYSYERVFNGDCRVMGLNVITVSDDELIGSETSLDQDELNMTGEESYMLRTRAWTEILNSMGLQCDETDFHTEAASKAEVVDIYLDGWMRPVASTWKTAGRQ